MSTVFNSIFTDSFHRANSSTVGNNWVAGASNTGTVWSIASDELASSGSSITVPSSWLIRPASSNPTTLITGTNEGSINQRIVIGIDYPQNNFGVVLRSNAACTKGYTAFIFGNNLFIGTIIGSSFNNTFSSPAIAYPTGCTSSDAVRLDVSVVSTDSTHTTLTATLYHVGTGLVLATATQTGDSTATLQSGDVGTSTYGLLGYATGSGSVTVNSVTTYTDQSVQIASTMTPAVATATGSTSGPNKIALAAATATTGGTGTLSYQWYRSTSAPSGGNYGKPLAAQNSLSITDLGLQCSTTYYYTLATTDQTTNNPQTVYSNTVSVATTAGSTGNPGLRSSMVMWADADALVGQTNGSPLVGPFGQFATYPSIASSTPNYEATTLPNNHAGLAFSGTDILVVPIGFDTSLAQVFGSSFSVSLVFNVTNFTNYQSLFKQGLGGDNTENWVLLEVGSSNIYASIFDGVCPTTPGFLTTTDGGYGTSPVVIMQFSYNAATNTMTIGNNCGTFTTYTVSPHAALGQYLQIGALLNTTTTMEYPLTGVISQVVIDNVALTQSQMISDQKYFNTRYNLNAGKTIIVCNGDSRTYGVDTSSYTGVVADQTPFPYPLQLADLLTNAGYEVIVKNVGHSGASASWLCTSFGYTASINANVLTDDLTMPRIYVCSMAGVNDYFASTSVTTVEGYITSAVENFETTFTNGQFLYYTVYCSEIDQNSSGYPEAGWDTYRGTLNSSIESTLGTSSIRKFVDLANLAGVGPAGSTANNSGVNLTTAFWGNDQLHLTGENSSGVMGGGYGAIAAAIAPIIMELLPSLIVPVVITPSSLLDQVIELQNLQQIRMLAYGPTTTVESTSSIKNKFYINNSNQIVSLGN